MRSDENFRRIFGKKIFSRTDNPFTSLQRGINAAIEDFVSELPLERLAAFGQRFTAFSPRIDLLEDGQRFVLLAELPGLSEDAVELTLANDTLTLRGEKPEEERLEGVKVHAAERTCGRFERSFSLPVEVDEDKIEASFNRGVLRVVLPKKGAAEEKKTKINIKTV